MGNSLNSFQKNPPVSLYLGYFKSKNNEPLCLKIPSTPFPPNSQYLAIMPDARRCVATQPAFTCSKLTIETLEQGVKYVQS